MSRSVLPANGSFTWLSIRRCTVRALLVLALAPVVTAAEGADSDWPWWRGPEQNGVATGKLPPLQWNATEKENIVWSAPINGRGHGSPIVFGDQVVLATADLDADKQELLSFNRDDGGLRWRCTVHQGGLQVKGNQKASLASSTPAMAGERLFVNFLNQGAMHTSAVSLEGEVLWQTKVTDYTVHQGYGSSPRPYRNLVIVSADNKGGGAVAALDQQSGKMVWTNDRPKKPNYASPVVFRLHGRDQLLLTGCDLVSSFEPLTGKLSWEIPGATTECVSTTVTDGQRIFTSGGYPKNHVSAVLADGSGQVQWANKTRVYVPSMLVRDGHIYAVADAGVAVCWKSDDGQELWKERLPGSGSYSASPVLIEDRVYAVSESGLVSVFRASPEGFELLAKNQLGDGAMATPAICGGRVYIRVQQAQDGRRQETLYCIGAR